MCLVVMCIICVGLLFFTPVSGEATSQSVISFGTVYSSRITEMVLGNEHLYAVAEDKSSPSTSYQIIEIDLVTGEEGVVYESNRRIHDMLYCDGFLVFAKPNIFHNNNSILCLNTQSHQIEEVVNQKHMPLRPLVASRKGIVFACEGESDSDIVEINRKGMIRKVVAAQSIRTISSDRIQYNIEGEPYRKEYNVSCDMVIDTVWPREFIIDDEVNGRAVGRIYDPQRGLIPSQYYILDKRDLNWRFRIADYVHGQYTFALLDDVVLIAQKNRKESGFTLRVFDLDTCDCIFSDVLDLKSCFFKINNRIYVEIVENGITKIIDYDYQMRMVE